MRRKVSRTFLPGRVSRGQAGAWDWCDVGCQVVRGKLKVQHNRMGIVPGHYPQHYTDFKCELDVHEERKFLLLRVLCTQLLPWPWPGACVARRLCIPIPHSRVLPSVAYMY